MFEFAIMLLPVAAASGWYVAFRHYNAKLKKPSNEYEGFFKGINYLLNEQPDKAIDVFIDLLEVDDETIETHLALGTLFRQRGEVEKSIRLHQNLIARPQISLDTRANILNELGLDYMRAGLLDRAENIFLELEKMELHEVNAVRQLLSIFQQEKEWLKAIDYATRLESIEFKKQPLLLSHLHCEAALLYRFEEDADIIKSHLRKALKIDPLCVRVNIISAEIEVAKGEYKQALKLLLKIMDQDRKFVPVFIDLILNCYDRLGRSKQKFDFLSELQESNESTIVVSRFLDVLLEHKGLEEASAFMHKKLRQHPSKSYLKLYAGITRPDKNTELEFLKSIIKQFDNDVQNFQCKQCGFTSVDLNWCCPSCQDWGVIEPIEI
ncbi:MULTISPECIES: lipopolysaccharide assembly protein LapB [Cycloclasticus]|jgi:lipopolysaccharide biosynthesis regulator YciM|uniref:lipopolysaccharide assembly protein LapB n=1 Tax=Cycloclasticus TaxID=34067 RepID=UPI0003759A30|nr:MULTISPECIES: lipopolysaccharide assembly protein LapB [Cycloclasticus]PHR51957.1 MAG: lipopolysaccharide assembly protein LapB [Cycloclasticus sp.]SHJ00049.1 Lipopolysaccharide biosynthesis regulator YciM, contains six TPR domains and a predicted metal-binding C-terminal domain [Cycloclasticus pugetii]|tara:strand:+ start:7857 stop:8996 length:1140 start_codon:yes stop_codon:yes gene_type:complete